MAAWTARELPHAGCEPSCPIDVQTAPTAIDLRSLPLRLLPRDRLSLRQQIHAFGEFLHGGTFWHTLRTHRSRTGIRNQSGTEEFGRPPSSDLELRMRTLSHGTLILPEEIGTAEPPIRTAESSPFFNMTRA